MVFAVAEDERSEGKWYFCTLWRMCGMCEQLRAALVGPCTTVNASLPTVPHRPLGEQEETCARTFECFAAASAAEVTLMWARSSSSHRISAGYEKEGVKKKHYRKD